MSEKEKIIIEQRTIEATRKGLMGFSGKIGVILFNMGDQILSHNTGANWANGIGYSSSTYDNYWYDLDEEKEEYPTMDIMDEMGHSLVAPSSEEWNQNQPNRQIIHIDNLGYHYDGLSRGYHLEMKCLIEDSEIVVHYKGYLVFKEKAGKLLAYAPDSEWEDKIERLYTTAKKIQESKKKEEKEQAMTEAKKNKDSFLDRLRKTWGI